MTPEVIAALQWRAGQLPGQTAPATAFPGRCHKPFNGGPDNCPAKQSPDGAARMLATSLQWRAGQLPGQTPRRPSRCRRPQRPFNGGPDNCPAKLEDLADELVAQIEPSMEGRTIARPNGPRVVAVIGEEQPSMEGRTIARPNRPARSARWRRTLAFNGGPDNCPAKPAPSSAAIGETRSTFNGGPDNCPAKLLRDPALQADQRVPSMEGRTIARPNVFVGAARTSMDQSLQWRAGQLPGQTRPSASNSSTRVVSFNGGPDNCPAKPAPVKYHSLAEFFLQWRAGQLPGQT